MKTYLHKLKEGFVLTSDERIKLTDICLNLAHRLLVNPTDEHWANSNSYNLKKVIALQDPLDFSSLTPEEQKKIGWFDVRSLSYEHYKSNEHYTTCDSFHYSLGFQKAQELLSDKEFDLEDLREAYNQGMMNQSIALEGLTYDRNFEVLSKDLSKTSWEVEIEMELMDVGYARDLYRDDITKNHHFHYYDSGMVTYKKQFIDQYYVPKFTNGKIKILRIL